VVRLLRLIPLVAILAAGRAEASSILVLESLEAKPAPSVTAANRDTAASSLPELGGVVKISPSVIVIGEPAVAEEVTATVEEEPARRLDPLVIRGGISGDAYVGVAPASTAATAPSSMSAEAGPVRRPE